MGHKARPGEQRPASTPRGAGRLFLPVLTARTLRLSVLAPLAQGVKPWARPWTTKGGAEMLDAGLPYNAASGRNYRGLNVPLLWAATAACGYSRHAWVSFKQAHELGGSVRKGEKATHVY